RDFELLATRAARADRRRPRTRGRLDAAGHRDGPCGGLGVVGVGPAVRAPDARSTAGRSRRGGAGRTGRARDGTRAGEPALGALHARGPRAGRARPRRPRAGGPPLGRGRERGREPAALARPTWAAPRPPRRG